MSKTRGIKSLLATAVGVGVVVTLLSGCASRVGDELATPSGTAAAPSGAAATPSSPVNTPEAPTTPSPAEPEQPVAPAVNLEDPSSWLVGFDGIGPIPQGGQIADVRSLMGAFVEDELPKWCPAARFQFEGQLVLVAHLADDFSTITGMFVGGGPGSELVSQSTPRTAQGIGAGSTFAELLNAYPTITKSGEYGGGEDPTHYYAIQNDNGLWLVFTGNDDVVDAISVRTTSRPSSEYCS